MYVWHVLSITYMQVNSSVLVLKVWEYFLAWEHRSYSLLKCCVVGLAHPNIAHMRHRQCQYLDSIPPNFATSKPVNEGKLLCYCAHHVQIQTQKKITTCSWWSSSCAVLSCHQGPSPLSCGTWQTCLPSVCWVLSAAVYGQTWATPACPPHAHKGCGWAHPGPRHVPLHRNPSRPAWLAA